MSLSSVIVPDQVVSVEMVGLFAEINGTHSIEINSPTIMVVEIACCRIVSPLMRLHIKPKASGQVWCFHKKSNSSTTFSSTNRSLMLGLALDFTFGFFRTTNKPAMSKTTRLMPPPTMNIVFDEVPKILSSSV